MSFAFDYDATLDTVLKENGLAPEGDYKPRDLAQKLGLNPPTPCNHKGGCNYNGPCAFVHPGEEGTGLKYFPERQRTDADGKVVTQKAAIRLVKEDGSTPPFYARRRLHGMDGSWAKWCARNKIAYTANRPQPRAQGQQPQGQQPQATRGPRPGSWASVASAPAPPSPPYVPRAAPAPAHMQSMPPMHMPPMHVQTAYGQPAYPYGVAPYQMPYGYDPHAYQEYLAFRAQQQQAQAQQQQQQWRDAFGNMLHPRVTELLSNIKDDLVKIGGWPTSYEPTVAGKITGMLLELNADEVQRALADNDLLTDHLFDACKVLVAQPKA